MKTAYTVLFVCIGIIQIYCDEATPHTWYIDTTTHDNAPYIIIRYDSELTENLITIINNIQYIEF